jgi:T5orf172 domain
VKFCDEHGRAPAHGEDKDIFERLYAVRLDRLRGLSGYRVILAPLDKHGLLGASGGFAEDATPYQSDDELLAELEVVSEDAESVTTLKHVRPRAEVRAAEDIANRTPCKDFDAFQPLFAAAKTDLDRGIRSTRRFGEDAGIRAGEFFILGGQMAYVADIGEEFTTNYERPDRRLRVVYDNATESDLLLRSLQRALYKDEAGRRITDPEAGPLFGNQLEDGDIESGTIYVLRSLSDLPQIADYREFIHKIGVTGGEVKARVANAKVDPTYLFADVEVVATYKLAGIKRSKFEGLLHSFFAHSRLDVMIPDRFGKKVQPREWFFVPLNVIAEVIDRIADGTITEFEYTKADTRLTKVRKKRPS